MARGLGLAVALILAGLAVWRATQGGGAGSVAVLAGVAALFALLAWLRPAALRPVFVTWALVSDAVRMVLTWVLLTLAFVLLVVPARLWMLLRGHDPLQRRFDPQAETYWTTQAVTTEPLERARRPF